MAAARDSVLDTPLVVTEHAFLAAAAKSRQNVAAAEAATLRAADDDRSPRDGRVIAASASAPSLGAAECAAASAGRGVPPNRDNEGASPTGRRRVPRATAWRANAADNMCYRCGGRSDAVTLSDALSRCSSVHHQTTACRPVRRNRPK